MKTFFSLWNDNWQHLQFYICRICIFPVISSYILGHSVERIRPLRPKATHDMVIGRSYSRSPITVHDPGYDPKHPKIITSYLIPSVISIDKMFLKEWQQLTPCFGNPSTSYLKYPAERRWPSKIQGTWTCFLIRIAVKSLFVLIVYFARSKTIHTRRLATQTDRASAFVSQKCSTRSEGVINLVIIFLSSSLTTMQTLLLCVSAVVWKDVP